MMSYYDTKPEMVPQDPANYYYARSYSDAGPDMDQSNSRRATGVGHQQPGNSPQNQGAAAAAAAAAAVAVNNNSYPPPLQYRMPLPNSVDDPNNPQGNMGGPGHGPGGHPGQVNLLPQPAYPPIYPQQHYVPDHGMSLPPPPPPPPTIMMPGQHPMPMGVGGGVGGGVGNGSTTLPPAASLAGPNYSTGTVNNTSSSSSGPPSHLMTTFNSKLSMRSLKKHACNVCGKRFTRPSSLQTHSYSHTGEKPFKCDYQGCGRHFSVVSNLRRHKKIHGPYN
jgi:hypothetical protein